MSGDWIPPLNPEDSSNKTSLNPRSATKFLVLENSLNEGTKLKTSHERT